MESQFRQKYIRQPSGIYFLGMIGAIVYFVQQATGFWMGAVGVLKAFVWPAFLIYKALEFLKM